MREALSTVTRLPVLSMRARLTYINMHVRAFRGLVGARVFSVDPHPTRAARCWSSCVSVGLCQRTYVARYLFLGVAFS